MTASDSHSPEDRVLIFAPTGREAVTLYRGPLLEALYQEIEAGVGVALLTAEFAAESLMASDAPILRLGR